MKTSFLVLAVTLFSHVATASDFVQCWSSRSEASELIVRLNIDSESASADSEGQLRNTRTTLVAQGMDIILRAEAIGDVSDEAIDVTLVHDDIIVGQINATKQADSYLLSGTVRAQGVRDNAEISIECVRHNLGN